MLRVGCDNFITWPLRGCHGAITRRWQHSGMKDLQPYLDGRVLYGDDFSPEQIARWHADEVEGYANLGAKEARSYRYQYHAWNQRHAYSRLPDTRFADVLGFGSAYGDELLPIIDRIDRITIVDPSASFVRPQVHGRPATYIAPGPDGRLALADASFDLITCFGVLHHIPNVSRVVAELARLLRPGGHFLLREPIVSMGDWRRPRPGLTQNERGIPLPLLEKIAAGAGLQLRHRALCGFPAMPRLFRHLKDGTYNSPLVAWLDELAARAFAWNLRYHATSNLQRLRPTSAFLTLRKPVT